MNSFSLHDKQTEAAGKLKCSCFSLRVLVSCMLTASVTSSNVCVVKWMRCRCYIFGAPCWPRLFLRHHAKTNVIKTKGFSFFRVNLRHILTSHRHRHHHQHVHLPKKVHFISTTREYKKEIFININKRSLYDKVTG